MKSSSQGRDRSSDPRSETDSVSSSALVHREIGKKGTPDGPPLLFRGNGPNYPLPAAEPSGLGPGHAPTGGAAWVRKQREFQTHARLRRYWKPKNKSALPQTLITRLRAALLLLTGQAFQNTHRSKKRIRHSLQDKPVPKTAVEGEQI